MSASNVSTDNKIKLDFKDGVSRKRSIAKVWSNM